MRFKLRQARRYIQAGTVIAYPTEAVYGLGCDPCNPNAVQSLLQIKQRSIHKGLILIASHPAQLAPFVDWHTDWQDEVLKTWPGPCTWLLPALPGIPYAVQGQHPRIACRVTAHPIAAALCDALGHALISTSANQSGRPPARTPLQVQQRCPGVAWVLHGALGKLSQVTPIYDACTKQQIR